MWQTDARTVPTQLAAIAVGVSEATIRKWASRGKLTRYGRPGRAEYHIDELTDLAAAVSPMRGITGSHSLPLHTGAEHSLGGYAG